MKVELAEPENYRELAKERRGWVDQSLLKMTLEVFGTTAILDMVNQRGGLPSRNWQTGYVEQYDKINGEAINDTILVEGKACFACPIACGRISNIKEGKYASKGEGPEFESIGAFGSMCDIYDLNAITQAHFLCNEYGIDTISAGSTIAFAMEAVEKGILKGDEWSSVKFGDPDVIIDLVHKIAKREGIGDLLAEGSKAMSEKIGQNSERFAMHVKGLELPAYDSRAAKITGLAYATANRGGDHITAYIEGPAFMSMPFLIVDEGEVDESGILEIPEETRIVKEYEDAFGVFDAISGCKFMGMVLSGEDWAVLIESLLGYEFSEKDFRLLGERIYNLERVYNIREGLTRDDDTLPKRLLEDPLPDGPAKGQVVNLDPLLDAYYEYRGWDKNGVPTPEKLTELGLEYLIEKM